MKKYEIIKEEFDNLIQKSIGLRYFTHCGYDEMGVTYGSSKMTLHAQIPFSFNDDEGELDDSTFFPFSEEEKPKLPSFVLPKTNIIFAKALSAFLFVNKNFREIINNSENEYLRELKNLFDNKDEQKTIKVDKIFSEASHTIWTLKQYLEYLNICSDNSLSFMNREKGVIENRTTLTISNTQKMSMLLTSYVITKVPPLISILVDYKTKACEHFSFPNLIYGISTSGKCFFKLCGMICTKLSDGSFFTILNDEEKWLKYEKGWEFINKNDISDYYVDSGFGYAVALFYQNITESTNREDLLAMIEASHFNEINSSPIILNEDNEDDINPTSVLSYENRCSNRVTVDIGNFHPNACIGMYNPMNMSHLNVACISLFYMKPIDEMIKKMSSQESPVYELSIVLDELGKPGGPVESRNLMRALDFQEDFSQNLDKTIKLLLEKITEHQSGNEHKILEYFALKKDYVSFDDCIIISDELDTSIELSINRSYALRLLDLCPQYLMVKIIRESNDNSRKEVPRNFNIDSMQNSEYSIFAIAAVSDERKYMLYVKSSETTWSGIYDSICFDVEDSVIENLFGCNDDENEILHNLHTLWLAEIIFYQKIEQT